MQDISSLSKEPLNQTITDFFSWTVCVGKLYGTSGFNPLNTKLNPTCHLLALLGAYHILHVRRIRVNFMHLCTHILIGVRHWTTVGGRGKIYNRLFCCLSSHRCTERKTLIRLFTRYLCAERLLLGGESYQLKCKEISATVSILRAFCFGTYWYTLRTKSVKLIWTYTDVSIPVRFVWNIFGTFDNYRHKRETLTLCYGILMYPESRCVCECKCTTELCNCQSVLLPFCRGGAWHLKIWINCVAKSVLRAPGRVLRTASSVSKCQFQMFHQTGQEYG